VKISIWRPAKTIFPPAAAPSRFDDRIKKPADELGGLAKTDFAGID